MLKQTNHRRMCFMCLKGVRGKSMNIMFLGRALGNYIPERARPKECMDAIWNISK